MTQFILDDLRHSILQKVGIRVVCPSDCQVIASAINKKLQKNISETTIKRLFGFAALNHKFSKFTINTLLEYVEDENVNNILASSLVTIDENWDYLLRKSKTLTEQTLRRIVNACTIPYELTIDRKFASHDFDYFYHSDFSFTVFISQPGYGRSILLSHLVQNHFINKEGKYHQDIVLFLHADKIFTIDHDRQNLEADIQKMLGLANNKSLTSYFDEQYEKTGKKLIIILDGFYDLLQHTNKNEVFDSILQLLCDIEESKAIKVVLSMRSYIWRRFFETIRHSHFLKNKWFTGSYFRLLDQSNVPVFTDTEVEQVLLKINPSASQQLSSSVKSQFKHPFHLYYYYHLKDEFPSSEFSTNLIFYEITLRHLLNRIYQSKHGVEKLILCKQFIQLSDYGKKGQKIDKNFLISEFTLFRTAYMDLLVDGILIEEKNNDNGFLKEVVRFVHPHVFEYFLFKETLERYSHRMNETFFDFIYNEYAHNKQHYALLEWSVFQFVKHHEFNLIEHVLKLELPTKEQNQLLLFMAENIKYLSQLEPDTKDLIRTSSFHQEIISNLADLDFLDPVYQKILTILCETTDDPEILAIYQSILCLFDCLTFNVRDINNRIHKLQTLAFSEAWQITPLEFTSFLFHKLTGTPTNTEEIFAKIESINHPKHDYNLLVGSPDQMAFRISKFYAVLLNWLFGIPLKDYNGIKQIYKSFPLIQHKSKNYVKYLIHLLALDSAKNDPGQKADQLERILNHIHKFPLTKNTNNWSDLIYHLMLGYQHFNRKEYEPAMDIIERGISLYKKDQYVMLELMAYQLMIKIHIAINDIDKTNEYRCLVFERLENNNINDRFFDFEMQKMVKTY